MRLFANRFQGIGVDLHGGERGMTYKFSPCVRKFSPVSVLLKFCEDGDRYRTLISSLVLTLTTLRYNIYEHVFTSKLVDPCRSNCKGFGNVTASQGRKSMKGLRNQHSVLRLTDLLYSWTN